LKGSSSAPELLRLIAKYQRERALAKKQATDVAKEPLGELLARVHPQLVTLAQKPPGFDAEVALYLGLAEAAIGLSAEDHDMAYAHAVQGFTSLKKSVVLEQHPAVRRRLLILNLYIQGIELNHLRRPVEAMKRFKKARNVAEMEHGLKEFNLVACLKMWADCLIDLRRFCEGMAMLDEAEQAMEHAPSYWDKHVRLAQAVKLDIRALRMQALNQLGFYDQALRECGDQPELDESPSPGGMPSGTWKRLKIERARATTRYEIWDTRTRWEKGFLKAKPPACARRFRPNRDLVEVIKHSDKSPKARIAAKQELVALHRLRIQLCQWCQDERHAQGLQLLSNCKECFAEIQKACKDKAIDLRNEWEQNRDIVGPRPIEEAALACLCIKPADDELRKVQFGIVTDWREATRGSPGWNWDAQKADSQFKKFWFKQEAHGGISDQEKAKLFRDDRRRLGNREISKQLRLNWQELQMLLCHPRHHERDRSRRFEVLVLRRWNSYTPSLAKAPVRSRGGGYFLLVPVDGEPRRLGIVVDPGFNFLENFLDAGFCVDDIDVIVVTHAHPDHSAGLISCLNTVFELHQLPDKDLWTNYCRENRSTTPTPHKVTLLLSPGVYEQYSSVLRDMTDLIRDIVRIKVPVYPPSEKSPAEEFSGDTDADFTTVDLRLCDTPSESKISVRTSDHDRAGDASVKLVFTCSGHTDLGAYSCLSLKVICKGIAVGFTGDARWPLNKEMKDFYDDCLALFAHVGSFVKPGEIDALESNAMGQERSLTDAVGEYNHLYYIGTMLLLKRSARKARQLCFRSLARN